MALKVVPWYGEPVTVLKDDYIEVKSAGFQDPPRKALQAVDDSFDFDFRPDYEEGRILFISIYRYGWGYRLDVLANDIRRSPSDVLTIVGVGSAAEGPFAWEMLFRADSAYTEAGARVSANADYVECFCSEGGRDELGTFYYQASDGSQTSVGRINTYYGGPAP